MTVTVPPRSQALNLTTRAALIAAAANAALLALVQLINGPLEVTQGSGSAPMTLSLIPVVVASLVPPFLALLGFRLLQRITRYAWPITLGVILLIVAMSMVGPLSQTGTITQVTLAVMHLVVGLSAILALRRAHSSL